MRKIILIRHGSTEFLKQGRYQGWSDPPLSRQGRAEVRRLGKRFRVENPDLIYVSPLKRACETAQILCSSEHILPDARLKEMSFGAWEGRTYEEIIQTDKSALQWWNRDMRRFRPGGGENLSDLGKRVRNFFGEILEQEWNTLVLVTHGGVIRTLIADCLGLSEEFFWKIDLATASMSVIEVHPKQSVLSLLNWTPHKIERRNTRTRIPAKKKNAFSGAPVPGALVSS